MNTISMRLTLILTLALSLSIVATSASPYVDWYRASSCYFKDEPSNDLASHLALVEDVIYLLGFSDGSENTPYSYTLAYSHDGSLRWETVKTVGSVKLLPPLPVRGGIALEGNRVYVVEYLNQLDDSSLYSARIIRLNADTGDDLDASMWLLGLSDWTWPVYPQDLRSVSVNGEISLYLVGTYLEDGKTPRGFVAKLEERDDSLHLSWVRVLYKKLFVASSFTSLEVDDTGLYITGSFLRQYERMEQGLLMKLDFDGRILWMVGVSSLGEGNVTLYDSHPKGEGVSLVGELRELGEPVLGLYGEVHPLDRSWDAIMLEKASLRGIDGACDLEAITGYIYDEDLRRNSVYVGLYRGMSQRSSAVWGSEGADFLASDLKVGDALYLVGWDDNVSRSPTPELRIIDAKPLPSRVDFSFLPNYGMDDVVASLERRDLIPDPSISMMEEFSSKTRDGFLLRIVVPTNLTLIIDPPGSGTTDPREGTHVYPLGTEVGVEAAPSEGWAFDHWELDGKDMGSSPRLEVLQCENHTMVAHFKERPSTEENKSEEAGGVEIHPPTICEISFLQFPDYFRFFARETDVRFNRDILKAFMGQSLPQQRAKLIILGGPQRIPFEWESVGVEFLKERGSYTTIRLLGSNNTYRASYGSRDYAVIYRECDKAIVRIAGITRYGTRAGLLWALDNLGELVTGPTLRLVEWYDLNGNGHVEPWEVTIRS